MTKPKIEMLQKVQFDKYTIELQKDSDGKLLQINYNGIEVLSIYDSFNPKEICFNFNSALKPTASMIQDVLSLAYIEKKLCRK